MAELQNIFRDFNLQPGYDCQYSFCRKLSKRESTRPRSNARNGSKQDEATPLTSKRDSAHVGSSSFLDQSCSLSDMQDMDIQGLSNNQVSASMQSFASDLQAVDLPVFEDSQNAGPGSPNDLALGRYQHRARIFAKG